MYSKILHRHSLRKPDLSGHLHGNLHSTVLSISFSDTVEKQFGRLTFSTLGISAKKATSKPYSSAPLYFQIASCCLQNVLSEDKEDLLNRTNHTLLVIVIELEFEVSAPSNASLPSSIETRCGKSIHHPDSKIELVRDTFK